MSISVISVKTLPLFNTNDMHKLPFNTFQLPDSVIPLDIPHKVNHKTPQYFNIPILNANNSFCSISRFSPLVTLASARKCEEIQEVSWNQVQCGNKRSLPEIWEGTSLQLEPNIKSPLRSIPDADISGKAGAQVQELLDWKHISIISQMATDIGRTNLIELTSLQRDPQLPPSPTLCLWNIVILWTMKLKLDEASIISRRMSDWASPILVVPKKEEHAETSNNTSISKNSQFNLWLCTDYRNSIVGHRQLTRLKPVEV